MRQRRTVLTEEQERGALEFVTLTGAASFGDALRAFLLALQQPGQVRDAVRGLGGVKLAHRAICGPVPYLDVQDAATREILEDRTLTLKACAERLNCSRRVVWSARRRLGMPQGHLQRIGTRLLPQRLEEDEEMRQALLDQSLSSKYIEEHFGVRQERVNRTRRRLGVNQRPKKVVWDEQKVALLRSGKSAQEIAHILGLAVRTVMSARQQIFGPLNRDALIRALRELGDVPVTAELLAYHLGRSTTAVRQLVKKVTGEDLP